MVKADRGDSTANKAEHLEGARNAAGAFLRDLTRSGQGAFRIAGFAEVAVTVAQIVQWGALAKLVEQLLLGRHDDAWVSVALVGVAGVFTGGFRWFAKARSDAGAVAVAASLRKRTLVAVLPDIGGSATVPSGAQAYAAFANIDDIADYAGATEAARRSVAPTMLLILTTVAIVHWPVALLLVAATAIMPGNMRLAGLAGLDASRERLREIDRLGAAVLESFRGMQALRSLRAFERRQAQIARVAARLNTLTLEVLGKAFLSTLVMDVVVTFAIAVCATYVGLVLLKYIALDVAPALTLFSGMFVLLLCPLYFLPLRRVAAGFHARDRAIAAAEAIETILSAPLIDRPGVSFAVKPGMGSVSVNAEGVTYAPPGSTRLLFEDLTLTAEAGEWTVITGQSGIGKTTLLGLLAGIREPQGGIVRWIGSDHVDLIPDVRAATWIGQHTVIIDGSVASNIMLGDRGSSRERVRMVAEQAGLGDLLGRLKDGLDTRIGDGGAGVSAGEARRIAIARALLRDAPVWFVDEPTSHLDHVSERQVLDVLMQATIGRTTIVVTHSPALIARADTHWHIVEGDVQVSSRHIIEQADAYVLEQ